MKEEQTQYVFGSARGMAELAQGPRRVAGYLMVANVEINPSVEACDADMKQLPFRHLRSACQ